MIYQLSRSKFNDLKQTLGPVLGAGQHLDKILLWWDATHTDA
jgi:hypothetical protein